MNETFPIAKCRLPISCFERIKLPRMMNDPARDSFLIAADCAKTKSAIGNASYDS
jgi:hypothetical protein